MDIPVFETKTRTADANDIYSYGFAFTSGDLDGAVKSLAAVSYTHLDVYKRQRHQKYQEWIFLFYLLKET